MAKYDPLHDHLARCLDTTEEVRMTFAEIEALVGPLPPSAGTRRGWWANNSTVQARAWRAAGWHVSTVDHVGERVAFARGARGGTYHAQRVNATVRGDAVPKAHAQATAVGPAATSMAEEAVQSLLVTYLVGQGWQIRSVANTATRERGIDILAIRDQRTLAVEVKGYPGKQYADPRRAGETKRTSPSVQARHWYAQAILKAMLTRDEHPDFDVAIALPDAPTYQSLGGRTKSSLDLLDIRLLFVTPDGHVRDH